MKKLLSLILALVISTTAFAFVGCAPTEQTPTNSKKIVVADFEQYKPDFQLMRLMNDFGAVNVNKDAQFVKSGTTSAKLQPLGGYAQKTNPYVYFPFESELFDYDYQDFTKYESISMWIYNAQSETKSMEVGLIASITDIKTVEKVTGMVCALTPGWNKVVYYPDLDILNLAYDVTGIPGVFIGFDNANSRYLDDAPVFYLDDLVITKADKAYEPKDVMEFAPGEIINFEKEYQKNVITTIVANPKCVPDISVVTSGEAGIIASNGDRMLRVVTKPGDTNEATWPMFVIPEKLVRKSGYMNIPKEEWSKYQICFDVYAETAPKTFFPEFFGSGGAGWKAYNVSTTKGQWTTFRLSLADMVENHVSNPGYIRIAWGEYTSGGEQVFYFDNFRYEKVA